MLVASDLGVTVYLGRPVREQLRFADSFESGGVVRAAYVSRAAKKSNDFAGPVRRGTSAMPAQKIEIVAKSINATAEPKAHVALRAPASVVKTAPKPANIAIWVVTTAVTFTSAAVIQVNRRSRTHRTSVSRLNIDPGRVAAF